MNRREFLASTTAGAVVFAGSVYAENETPIPEEMPPLETPQWAAAQIDEVRQRIDAWKGTDVGVVFPLVSDIHAGNPGFSETPDFRDTKTHVRILQRAATQIQADFMAELGDIGFDRDSHWNPSTPEHAQKRLASQQLLYRDFSLPVLFCMGNHDTGRAFGGVFGGKRLSNREYGEMFNGQTRGKGFPLVVGPNGDYGYYDLPGKPCRVFFLNSSEAGERGYSQEQVQFLADHLRMPKDFCAVVLQHISIHRSLGPWLPATQSAKISYGETARTVLEAFVQKEKGEKDGVRWDFTQNQNTTLAGCIFGHSHFGNQIYERGVHYILTQSYGTIHDENLPDFADYTRFGRKESLLCDIVVLKPAQREMRIFRLGAGGAEKDRDFHF
ncbi:MAG: metallophosphoesterase [Planctomycetia bacterium]|nr:metallophosphoesterase [Planctomycetia bacterium]